MLNEVELPGLCDNDSEDILSFKVSEDMDSGHPFESHNYFKESYEETQKLEAIFF